MALQYGMSTYEFWHEDKKLFNAYRKAYYNHISEQSWLNGLYVNLAITNLVGNIFKKKGEQTLEYPESPIDVFKKHEEKITPDNVEQNFRELMMRNSNWLKSRNNKT